MLPAMMHISPICREMRTPREELEAESPSSTRLRTASIFEERTRLLGSVPKATTSTTSYSSGDTSPVSPRNEELAQIQATFKQIRKDANEGRIPLQRAKLMVHELLSKVLAYDTFSSNTIIKIPVLTGTKFKSLPYKTAFLNLVDGNAAYLLRPLDKRAPPIVLFRGTDATYSFGSLRADLGMTALTSHIFSSDIAPPIDVGRTVIQRDGKFIKEILENVSKDYGKCILMGHSLGGKLASSFAINGINHQFISEVYTFNSPGVTKEELNKYEQLGRPFEATACTVEGDWIGNGIGFKRFFGVKHVIDPKGLSLSRAKLHTTCLLSTDAKVEIIEADHRAMTKGRIVKRVIKYSFIVPIALAILSRVGYILLALIVEGVYASGFNDPLKKEHESGRMFFRTHYAHALLMEKTDALDLSLSLSDQHRTNQLLAWNRSQ